MLAGVTGQKELPGKTAGPVPVREGLVPNPKARLKEQFHEVCRFKHVALRTEEAYLDWIKRFLVFCRDHPHLTPALSPPSVGTEREKGWRHPQDMSQPETILKHSTVNF